MTSRRSGAGRFAVHQQVFQSAVECRAVFLRNLQPEFTTAQTVVITVVHVDQSLTPVARMNFVSVGNEPLLDDAVTYSTNHVGIASTVVSAEVGVRIAHPRESDLTLTLISPQGTRVLLAENRGGLDTNGYGWASKRPIYSR